MAGASEGRHLKSETGLPPPGFPRDVDLRGEARRARRRLLPVTLLYTAYACTVLVFAVRSPRPLWVTLVWYLLGAAAWTYLEYFAHRRVLHGVFPNGPGLVARILHRRFDHLHWEHHARPWDGNHVNGTTRDTLPLLALPALLSFLAPVATLPTFMAGFIQAYIVEEWVHHSVHFCHFKGRYFQYIRKHHLYHHGPRGAEVAYGLTSGLWDRILSTPIDPETRRLLYDRRA
jgi:hypothetical protein